MKMHRIQHPSITTVPALLGLTLALAAWGGTNTIAADFSFAVPFELGEAEFYPGDSITIQKVTGTSPTIHTGETYCVEGTYTLASKEKADLALFATAVSKVNAGAFKGFAAGEVLFMGATGSRTDAATCWSRRTSSAASPSAAQSPTGRWWKIVAYRTHAAR